MRAESYLVQGLGQICPGEEHWQQGNFTAISRSRILEAKKPQGRRAIQAPGRSQMVRVRRVLVKRARAYEEVEKAGG